MRSGVRLGVVVLFVSTALPARAMDPQRPLSQLHMTVWDRSRGFPAHNVFALAQTDDGYLWMGTTVGLVRYDGKRFTSLTHETHAGLPSDQIIRLWAGRDGLWIGTARGLARHHDGVISAFGAAHGLPDEYIYEVYEDRSGRLWVSTRRTVFRLEGGRFVSLLDPDGTPAKPSLDILETRDGTVWIAGSPLRRWKDGKMEVVPGDPSLARGRLAEDADGNLWAVGHDKLLRLRGDAWEHFDLPANAYSDLLADSNGALWITGPASGLVRRHPDGRVEALLADQGLPSPNTSALLVDREGSLWVATTDSGVVRLRESRVTPFSVREGLPQRRVATLAVDDGRVWVGTNSGLALIQAERVEIPASAPREPVFAVHVDRRGRLWFATTKGLFRQDGERAEHVDPAFVFDLAEDVDGNIWAGTTRGLLHITEEGKETLGAPQGLPAAAVMAVRSAGDGSAWMATQDGPCRLATGKARCFGAKDGAPTAYIHAIHDDAEGTIWITTREAGLYRFRDGRFFRFGVEHGLLTDTHYDVLEDDRGRLWTATHVGIMRIDKSSLERVATGASPRAEVRLFTERDGMRTADCTGPGRKTRDGRLWFGTYDGVVAVDPAIPDPEPPVIAAVIENAGFSGRTVPAPREVELPAGSGWFSLRFAAPTVEWGPEVTFRYQLAGFDDNWVQTSDVVASYTNVPPGSYRFAVQVRAPQAPWGPAAEVELTVPPRLWQTSWFRASLVAAAALLLFGVYRWRLAVLVRRQRQLEAVVEERTRQLADANATLEERVDSAVQSLRQAERMAAYGEMVVGVAHEVRQPVFALRNAAHVLAKNLQGRTDVARQVALVQSETQRMSAIVDELLDFARPAGLARAPLRPWALVHEGVDVYRAEHDPQATLAVEIDVAPDLPAALLDHVRMVQVLVNLMANAKKHAAGATRVGVRGAVANDRLRLEVSNDGAGIPAEDLPHIFQPFFSRGGAKGTGLGLAIVRRIVTEHGGDIQASSDAAGATFTIELPMREGQ